MLLVIHRTTPPKRVLLSLLVWAILLALAWLDARAHPADVHLSFFGFIIGIIEAIAGVLGAAGGAIATALAASVQWLMHATGWITKGLGKFLSSTGSMFKKIWETSKVYWHDVIKPAIKKLSQWVKDFRTWIRSKLVPILKAINKVQDRIRRIYDRFIKPVLDVIEYTRGVLSVLKSLHVKWAEKLDNLLGEWQSAIEKNFRAVVTQVNHIGDILNSVLTAELLFQRLPFLRTAQRDVRWIWRILINSRAVPRQTTNRKQPLTLEQIQRDTEEVLLNGTGRYAPFVTEMSAVWKKKLGV